MSDNRFDNTDWLLLGAVESTNKELRKRNEIEEEKLMLQKAQAFNDMSIYEEYIAQRDLRRREEEEKRTKSMRIIIVSTIILVDAMLGFLIHIFTSKGITNGIMFFAAVAVVFTISMIAILLKS